jgi:hypothetical protein
MYFEVYEMENLLLRVTWDIPDLQVGDALVENFEGIKNISLMPISFDNSKYTVPFTDIWKFLETRCVPRTRVDIDNLLKQKYNLREYSALGIVKRTHGVSMNDYIWIKFEGEDESINFESTKVRL